ncbi:helix-turn-helix domain-containing protein [Gandjariella thermophila]|nr:helix-turn-helix transcriptional regulator [Gandjariella thermophila]
MKAQQRSTVRLRELGDELRQARVRAGFSGSELARRLGWSRPRLTLMETGRRTTPEANVFLYLGQCRADAETVERVKQLVRERDTGYLLRPHQPYLPDELSTMIMLESAATAISGYEPVLISGLLQTEDYARAIMARFWDGPAAELEPFVAARMARQSVLQRWRPPQATFYLHEAALHHVVGGLQVMHEQMLRLALMANWSQVTIRVVPLSAPASPALGYPARLLEFADHDPVAHADTDTATVFLEDPAAIRVYRRKFNCIADVALGVEESRSLFAQWANTRPARGGPA